MRSGTSRVSERIATAPRRTWDAGGIAPAGLAQLAGSIVLLGGAWPITKYAVNTGATPLWFAEGRAVLSCLAAAVLLGVMRRLRVPGRADLPALLSVGLLQLAAFFALVHAAVAWVPAGRTAILCNVTSVFVAPLSLLVLREPISRRRWAATSLGLAGVVVLMGPWAIDWSRANVLVGHAFLLGAAAGWAVTIIVVRRFPPRASMLELLPWCFGLASLVLLPLVLLEGGGVGRWSPGGVAALAFIGLLAGPVGTWCVMQAAVSLPALVASVGFLGTPVTGLLLASAWLGEPMTADLLFGSALVLGGVFCAAWPGRVRA